MLVRERIMDRGEQVSTAWAAIREGLKRDCGARLFDHWLKPIMLAGMSDKGDVIRLTLPTEFHANWVRAHYADRLLLAWRASMPAIREVRIEVAPSEIVTRIYTADEADAVPTAPPVPGFDPRQTFDRFVVDDENRVACNAAKAIANVDGDSTYVRVQVLTNAGALDRDKQLKVVEQLTDLVASAAGDATLKERTWVLLTEGAPGGWGLWGHAHSNEELVGAARAEIAKLRGG